MSDILLVSIKEEYVNKILSGEKTIELRKSKPKAKIGDTIVIYTTVPKKAITAIANIKDIVVMTPKEMWDQNNNKLGISQEKFDIYYSGCEKAVGIELENIYKLSHEIFLSAIKAIYPNFSPPQTFRYLNKFETLKKFHSKK